MGKKGERNEWKMRGGEEMGGTAPCFAN